MTTDERNEYAEWLFKNDTGFDSFAEDDVELCVIISKQFQTELTLKEAGVVRKKWEKLQRTLNDLI